MKLVIIGDFHIPSRAEKLPDEFEKRLREEDFDRILCTGDFTNPETYEMICSFGDVESVLGNMDIGLDLPNEKVLKADDFKIGLTHGKDIYPRGNEKQLLDKAESMDADILIHGHTHRAEVKEKNGTLLINPGTATGAWGGSSEETDPSFMILELGKKVRITTLRIHDGKLEEKVEIYNYEEL